MIQLTKFCFLMFILLSLANCSTAKPKVKIKTLETCMAEVKEKVHFKKMVASRAEIAEAEMGIYAVCEDSNYDSDLAYKKIEDFKDLK